LIFFSKGNLRTGRVLNDSPGLGDQPVKFVRDPGPAIATVE
jgi:hypothetical protein